MLIRIVSQSKTTCKWAFIEYSDEDKNVFSILGDKEFDTKEEATQWAEGFDIGSYVRENPSEIKGRKIHYHFTRIELANLMQEFTEYLQTASFSAVDIPVNIKARMFLDQRKVNA